MENDQLSKDEIIEIAQHIEHLKLVIHMMDIDKLRKAAEQLKRQANFYDSAAALNRNYTSENSDLLAKQAEALLCLVKFIDLLIECDELKKRKFPILRPKESDISKMFL